MVASLGLLLACGEVLTAADGGNGNDDGGNAFDAGPSFDATPPDPCDTNIALEDAESCIIQVFCEYFDRCTVGYPDVATCIQDQQGGEQSVFMRRMRDAIAAGKVNYDGAKAAECLALMSAARCSDFENNDDDARAQACDAVFTGTAANGAGCFEDQECATRGARCDITTPGQCGAGTCDDPTPTLFDCSLDSNCEPGSYCVADTTGGNPKCQNGENNAPCDNEYDCDSAFWCDTATVPGTCKPDFAAGASCAENAQCPSGTTCVGNDVSGQTIGMCQAVDTVDAKCDDDCEGRLFCLMPDISMLGDCKPYPSTVGASCAESRFCDGGLYCEQGNMQCAARKGLNASCVDSDECNIGLFCDREITMSAMGQCKNPQASGTVCNSDRHCMSHVCEDNGSGVELCFAYDNCYN